MIILSHPADALPLPEPDFIVFDAEGLPVPAAYTDVALRAAHRRGYALAMSEVLPAIGLAEVKQEESA